MILKLIKIGKNIIWKIFANNELYYYKFYYYLCLLLFNVFKDVYLFVTKITSNIRLQALFLVGFYFIIEYIIGIFLYYHQFSIERYGFNKSTIKHLSLIKLNHYYSQ